MRLRRPPAEGGPRQKGRVDEKLLLSFESLEETHWWFVVRRGIVLDAIARPAPRPVQSILDVGCGTGGTMRVLRTRFPNAEIKGIVARQSKLRTAIDEIVADIEGGQ